jgi:membrane fusion protein, multidrug efflux system
MRRMTSGSLILLALTAAACGQRAESASATLTATVATVRLAPENVATATTAVLSAGPLVSGQLTPAREASVRALVGGAIVSLTIDRGQPVATGQVIAKIASRDLEDAFQSAQSAVKSAESALAVARSEYQRTETLVKGGALAARDLEQAGNAVTAADAQLAAARSRQKSVWQQLEDTTVKAPFAGVVSERPANMGDVVAPGTPLVTIIDLSSLRLEALVPSDQISRVRPGARVQFNVRGIPNQTFTGSVDRLSPTADPVTRQISIFVTLPNVERRLIAGLFVEGRVEAETRKGIVVPLSAVDETGPMPVVTRIRDGKAERVSVELGLRQSERELVEITKGLAAGDVVIVGSTKGIAPGTAVQVVGR